MGEVQAPMPWRFLREATGQGWRGTSGCRVTSGFLDQGCRGVVEDAGLEEQGRLCPQGLLWCENGEHCVARMSSCSVASWGSGPPPGCLLKPAAAQKPPFLAPALGVYFWWW